MPEIEGRGPALFLNDRLRRGTAKAAAATMAAWLLATQAPGFAGSVYAAKAEPVTDVAVQATVGSDSTSNEVPEGAKISSEQARNHILELFPVLKRATIASVQFGSSHVYPQPEYKTWEIGFSVTEGNHTLGFSATVHAVTGEVLSAHLPSELLSRQHGEPGNDLTSDEADKLAEQFLYKAIPGLKETDYVPVQESYVSASPQALFGRTEYHYSYQLKRDGLLSDAETANVSVDSRGSVTGFSRSTLGKEYPSSKPGATAEEARRQFEKQFDVQLAYIPKERYSSRAGQKYVLGYVPAGMTLTPMDASTLEHINAMTGKASTKESTRKDRPLKGSANAFAAHSGEKLTAKQAEERVREHFDIPENYQLEYSQLNKSQYMNPNGQVWSLSWSNRNASASYMFMRDISAQVDAATGQIYSYNVYQRNMTGIKEEQQAEEAAGKTMDQEAAEQLAMNKVIELVPNAAKEFKLSQVLELEGATTFVFQRYVGDIVVQDDMVQLQVLEDGTISEFYTRALAAPEQLPTDTKPAISYEKAKASYLEQLHLVLAFSRYGGYSLGGAESVPFGVKLAYVPSSSETSISPLMDVLDANTGEWKKQYGSDASTGKAEASDIEGHAAEASIRNMLQHGVTIPDDQGRVMPDRVITRGEWFTVLARALQPNLDIYHSGDGSNLFADVTPESPYYQAIRVLIDQRWIAGSDPEISLKPDEELTREELAVLLVRILRYEKLAGFYTLPSDLPNIADAGSITNKGAASLSLKLGLLPSIEGRFMPARKVTVAEAAQVLERLAKLQGKTDTFMDGSRLY
ncbi:YcdB/YcdC domain-containing protein [Paenibacillus sp. FSL W8-0426]|uniref:YcdB/YcdC domain-containing protein n=1 Tax=Paenibacillus sp. FSL W8-0426 TaxID=2921714 RepID=UPI0030DB3B76